MEQPGGRGYPLNSRLREPTNPLSRMPRLQQVVRYTRDNARRGAHYQELMDDAEA